MKGKQIRIRSPTNLSCRIKLTIKKHDQKTSIVLDFVFKAVEVFFYFAGGEESLKGKQIRIRSPTNLSCRIKLTIKKHDKEHGGNQNEQA